MSCTDHTSVSYVIPVFHVADPRQARHFAVSCIVSDTIEQCLFFDSLFAHIIGSQVCFIKHEASCLPISGAFLVPNRVRAPTRPLRSRLRKRYAIALSMKVMSLLC